MPENQEIKQSSSKKFILPALVGVTVIVSAVLAYFGLRKYGKKGDKWYNSWWGANKTAASSSASASTSTSASASASTSTSASASSSEEPLQRDRKLSEFVQDTTYVGDMMPVAGEYDREEGTMADIYGQPEEEVDAFLPDPEFMMETVQDFKVPKARVSSAKEAEDLGEEYGLEKSEFAPLPKKR